MRGAGNHRRWLGLGAVLVLVCPTGAGAATQPRTVSASGAANPAFTGTGGCGTGSPAYNEAGSGDAPDPQVVYSNGHYYAFSTGTALGNHLQVVVSTAPTTGYHSTSGLCYGSSALPTVPSWEAVNTETSPGVFSFDNRWVMFYDAAKAGHASDSGYDCLSVATASSISPTLASFKDSSSGPLECQATGSIDPSPYVDPATGKAYVIWKQNDGGSSAPAYLWARQLASTGATFAAGSSPSELLTNNTNSYPWEATVENPDMFKVGTTWYLLFSAGRYQSSGYSEAITTCNGPLGPCNGSEYQIVTTYGSVLGPGGGAAFSDATGAWWLDYAGWLGGSSGCTTYSCGAARRLFVTRLSVPGGYKVTRRACSAPKTTIGYRMVGAEGNVYSFKDLPNCGQITGTLPERVTSIADVPDGGGYWVVTASGKTFAFGNARLSGTASSKPHSGSVVGISTMPTGKGYVEAGSRGNVWNFGTAKFHGSMAGKPLGASIVGITMTSDGKGYWMVASDGGVFAYGDAHSFGSEGGKHLNRPIVGIAPTATGLGYWLVGSDGGIFTFGRARFLGSEGGKSLNAPIVAIAATPHGRGYWELGADGGMFSFGKHITFFGSAANKPRDAPIVAMATE